MKPVSPPREEFPEQSSETVERPIFIGGLDRSGKTTMRAFLTSHPNIAIPAVGSNMETYFYGQFGDLAKLHNLDRCLRAMLRYKHVRHLKPDVGRIRCEFLQGPPTYERLFSLFLIHYAEREGKARWGAQTGLIERYADQLFETFPETKIIHMVRDPRDRYAASLELWPEGKGRAGGATARWRYSMSLAERNMHRYPTRYRLVRFEDMVLRPEQVLRQVCAFLGETYHPGMLGMSGAPAHRAKLADGAGSSSVETGLSSAFIGRFREQVPAREIAFIQLHAGRPMRDHGYTPLPVTLSAPDRLRFALLDWPSQMGRLVAWRGLEAVQHRFPAWLGRKPDRRMILSAMDGES